MITSGLRDSAHFPLDSVEKLEEANLGSEHFRSVKFDDGHKFNDSEKAVAYQWLDECLDNI